MRLPFTIGNRPIQGNFDALLSEAVRVAALLTAQLGGLSLKVGSSSATFTASSTSAQVTIPHGLGKVPIGVFAIAKQPANARVTMQETAAPDATNIFLSAFQTQGTAISVSQAFYWLAIG